MILLDTCAIVHAALTPECLGSEAAEKITLGQRDITLACCDISLWEIAMLVRKGRVKVSADCSFFIQQVVSAFRLKVIPIVPKIAALSADDSIFGHKDPCDRIIAATALHHNLPLITSDRHLKKKPGLVTVW